MLTLIEYVCRIIGTAVLPACCLLAYFCFLLGSILRLAICMRWSAIDSVGCKALLAVPGFAFFASLVLPFDSTKQSTDDFHFMIYIIHGNYVILNEILDDIILGRAYDTRAGTRKSHHTSARHLDSSRTYSVRLLLDSHSYARTTVHCSIACYSSSVHHHGYHIGLISRLHRTYRVHRRVGCKRIYFIFLPCSYYT